jgi:DNA mismatch endonuclease (patch repair protein)
MSAIRGKDTKPELVVRRIVHGFGFRFRLHRRDLPGVPDLVFPRWKKIIFVHGCYWHMHNCRWGCVTPKTNAAFWRAKRAGNVERDTRNSRNLKELGWKVLIVWECETTDTGRLGRKLRKFLAAGDNGSTVHVFGNE